MYKFDLIFWIILLFLFIIDIYEFGGEAIEVHHPTSTSPTWHKYPKHFLFDAN